MRIGLIEVGQTSFANSILQCLVNYEEFVKMIITAKREGTKIPNEIYNFIYRYRIDKDSHAADALIFSMFSKSNIVYYYLTSHFLLFITSSRQKKANDLMFS